MLYPELSRQPDADRTRRVSPTSFSLVCGIGWCHFPLRGPHCSLTSSKHFPLPQELSLAHSQTLPDSCFGSTFGKQPNSQAAFVPTPALFVSLLLCSVVFGAEIMPWMSREQPEWALLLHNHHSKEGLGLSPNPPGPELLLSLTELA